MLALVRRCVCVRVFAGMVGLRLRLCCCGLCLVNLRLPDLFLVTVFVMLLVGSVLVLIVCDYVFGPSVVRSPLLCQKLMLWMSRR